MKRPRVAATAAASVAAVAVLLIGAPGGPPIRPDPASTPGAVDPSVTQANLAQTICSRGYATQHRPPDDAKWRASMAAICARYRVAYDPKAQEMDHEVSIELGGAPADPANLWPETYSGQWNARVKDRLENELHREVCADEITLAEAQKEIKADWVASYRDRFEDP